MSCPLPPAPHPAAADHDHPTDGHPPASRRHALQRMGGLWLTAASGSAWLTGCGGGGGGTAAAPGAAPAPSPPASAPAPLPPPPPPAPPPSPSTLDTAFDVHYAAGFALTQSTATRTYALRGKPAKTSAIGAAGYIDAAHGTRVYRLTQATAEANGQARLRHEYSRRNPFNADSSRYIAQATNGFWYLFRADTFARLTLAGTGGALPGLAGDCEPFWHPTDANKLWFTANNGGMAWSEIDVSTGAITALFDLTGKLPAGYGSVARTWTKSEGRPSNDGRYWCLMCETSAFDTVGIVCYDRVQDRVIGHLTTSQRPDHVSMSPLGHYMVPSWAFQPTLGTRAIPRDHQGSDPTAGIQLHTQSEHSDLCVGADGTSEFYVYFDYTAGELRAANLATGAKTSLMSLYPVSGESFAGHVSGIVSQKKPGWFILSTYASSANYGNVRPAPTVRAVYDRVMAVEIKANPRILHIAETHASGSEYFNEPQATSNADGTRIVWASAFNGRAGAASNDTESFMAGIPSGAIPG